MRTALLVVTSVFSIACTEVSPDPYQGETVNEPNMPGGQIYDLGSAQVVSASPDGCGEVLGYSRLGYSSLTVIASPGQMMLDDGDVAVACAREGNDFSCLSLEDVVVGLEQGDVEMVIRDTWGSLSLANLQTYTALVYECSGSDCTTNPTTGLPIRDCAVTIESSFTLR